MKLWYKDFGIEFDGMFFQNNLKDFLKSLKAKYEENRKCEYQLALVLKETNYVKEILKVKVSSKKLEQYIENDNFLLIHPFSPPNFNVDIFEKEEIVCYMKEEELTSKQLALNVFTGEFVDKDIILNEECIKIFY